MPRVNERPVTSPPVRSSKNPESPPHQPDDEPSSGTLPRSETRIATRPSIWAAVTDEAWARDLTGAPVVEAAPNEIRILPLDPDSGFLLSLMDGTMDLETVIELSQMPRARALRIIRDLFEFGVVAFS